MERITSLSALLAVTLVPLAACGKGNPGALTPYTKGLTPPTEEQRGTIGPHALAYFTFNANRLGPVNLGVTPQLAVPPPLPVLFLTLRVGQCPDNCGQLIADSNRGNVAAQVGAGSYSVIVGNPNDQAVPFLLVMEYPK